MPIDTPSLLLALAGVVLVGFLGILLFERTRIPDLVWLLLLGILVGPVNVAFLHLAPLTELITPGRIDLLTPPLATLALIVILFEGGLNIHIRDLRTAAAATAFHTAAVFILTAVLVYVIAVLLLEVPPVIALLEAFILAGTSGAVMVSLTRRMRMGPGVRLVLVLEAILTTVVATALVLAVLRGLERGTGIDGTFVAGFVTANLALGYAVGLPVGLAWLFVVHRVHKVPFAFMTTLAISFLLYVLAEAVNGSGLLAVLVFGIVLGNGEVITARLGRPLQFPEDPGFRRFMQEVSFLFSAFFFVLLGILFQPDPAALSAFGTSLPILSSLNGTVALVAVALLGYLGAFVLARAAAAPITLRLLRGAREDRGLLWALFPRAKAAAVLSLLPFASASYADVASPYHATLAPYRSLVVNTALLVILFSVLTTAASAFVLERRRARIPPPPQPERE